MTTQYERDFRSARKEWQRSKDSATKWSHGSRHLAGIKFDRDGDLFNLNTPEHQLVKFRPGKKPSQHGHPYPKTSQNLIKCRPNNSMPDNRRRSKLYAQHEIRDGPAATTDAAAADFSSSPLASPLAIARSSSSSSSSSMMTASNTAVAAGDPFVYSFDRTDSPGGPLTLEVFVKPGGGGLGGGRGDQTEKLVEREYEVLDGNGEAVRGRKARAVLRRCGTGTSGRGGEGEEGGEEDEGFELL
ncbi:hypothetical protein N658DRAFT_507543 [Parathielavia hyrcaniae]|uniref:Uncharacterized protein n=1 Tax=Parathielavia hyrcaniae TaxID=113614 RepID=A0AAN6Q251_9PEZI|nr:hypothetical protein N658DRAFT_507543 [Parathielavia hyrcaniae]